MPNGVTDAEGPQDSLEGIDVAVAHWGINAWGGAEYLVTKLAEALNVGRVFTLGDPSPSEPNPYGDVRFVDVTPSLSTPRLRRLQQTTGRVFGYAQWEDVDWRQFGDPDVLVTSGATTRAVITPDDTLHVNYCHSPPRWYYDLYHDRKDSLTGILARPLIRYLRTRDAAIDARVDHYLVNSPIIERRLWKYYKREGTVLYPPIDLDTYYNSGDEGFYLHLGRLDEEKGVPAVVDAFAGTDHQLVLAGGMGDISSKVRARIERLSNIDYRGFVPEETKYDLLSRCRAVVFNGQNEDFGIVPIEANASGKPVLARDEGFPGIYVTDGENGYKHDGTIEEIQAAIERAEASDISGTPSTTAERFRYQRFESELRETIATRWEQFASLDT